MSSRPDITTSLAPWLSVEGSAAALAFYKQAFDARETYRLDDENGGVVVKLSIQGAEFWLSDGKSNPVGESPVRMILTVADPDAVFEKAVQAGATVVFPVEEGHGWRLGRIVDPFGHHWEIGRPLDDGLGDVIE